MLPDERDTHLVDFATKRGRNLCYCALHLDNFGKSLLNSLDDICRCRLYRALCALHRVLHNLEHGEVVYSITHIVRRWEVAQWSADCQIDAKAVANLLFEVVAAVIGT